MTRDELITYLQKIHQNLKVVIYDPDTNYFNEPHIPEVINNLIRLDSWRD